MVINAIAFYTAVAAVKLFEPHGNFQVQTIEEVAVASSRNAIWNAIKNEDRSNAMVRAAFFATNLLPLASPILDSDQSANLTHFKGYGLGQESYGDCLKPGRCV